MARRPPNPPKTPPKPHFNWHQAPQPRSSWGSSQGVAQNTYPEGLPRPGGTPPGFNLYTYYFIIIIIRIIRITRIIINIKIQFSWHLAPQPGGGPGELLIIPIPRVLRTWMVLMGAGEGGSG